MIADEEIDKTLNWLVEQAPAASKARASRIYLEEYRKTIKAQIMGEHNDKSLGVQEREAYADPRYIAHLEIMKQAIQDDEKMRWLNVAATAKIDAWRSQQANYRIQGRIQ